MQIERPEQINKEIETLLSKGTVEELRSEKGQFLRLFFSADEVARAMDLPMGEILDFDGVTCKWCRGDMRFKQCGKCHGSFDDLVHQQPVAPMRVVVQHENKKRDVGMVKMFFDRMIGRNASY